MVVAYSHLWLGTFLPSPVRKLIIIVKLYLLISDTKVTKRSVYITNARGDIHFPAFYIIEFSIFLNFGFLLKAAFRRKK